MPMLTLHRMTSGTGETAKTYFFLSNPTAYADGDVATATGIYPATEAEQDNVPVKVGDLIGNGKAFRVKATYVVGTTRKTVSLLCSTGKAGTVLDGLNEKGFRGGTIKGVRFPRKMYRR